MRGFLPSLKWMGDTSYRIYIVCIFYTRLQLRHYFLRLFLIGGTIGRIGRGHVRYTPIGIHGFNGTHGFDNFNGFDGLEGFILVS